MENNPPVPVRTKIAAWMLIGLAIATAINAIRSFVSDLTALLAYPDFILETIQIPTYFIFIAFIIAFISFICGIPIFFRQKNGSCCMFCLFF